MIGVREMGKVRKDLTGMKFGRLTVIKQIDDYISPSGNRYSRWLCQCSCKDHNCIPVLGGSLKSGNTLSCGCLERELKILRQKKFNEYKIIDNVVIGKSSNSDDEFFVDLDDFEKIKDICWSVYINKSNMKELRGWDQNTKKTYRMHAFLGFDGYDHKDRNELNNRKNNLRIATNQEQVWNRSKSPNKTSEVIGVSYCSRDDLWCAEFMYNGKRILRKTFKSEIEAIMCRLNTEVKYIKNGFSGNRHLYDKYGITIQNDYEVVV